MAYLLRNICTKKYWNRTTIVEIIVDCWVVSFFETQCISIYGWHKIACGQLGEILLTVSVKISYCPNFGTLKNNIIISNY